MFTFNQIHLYIGDRFAECLPSEFVQCVVKFTSNDADGYFGYELVELLNYSASHSLKLVSQSLANSALAKYCDKICDPFPYFMERLRECTEVETNNDWAFLAINALTHHRKHATVMIQSY